MLRAKEAKFKNNSPGPREQQPRYEPYKELIVASTERSSKTVIYAAISEK